jgi:Domain of unknown function (DUF4956)
VGKKISTVEAVTTGSRILGRQTLVRLTLYYIGAGLILFLLTALFPGEGVSLPQAPAPTGFTDVLRWLHVRMAVLPSGAPLWVDALVQMLSGLLLVLPMAFVYVRTRTRQRYDRSLIQTVVMLPIVVTAILVVVRDSLALAFSLAGIVAAVRFRNTLKESGDAVYIFGSIGLGFATGIHAIAVAMTLSVLFVVLELTLWRLDLGAEFEQTFTRLCLPSGGDLAAMAHSSFEPPRAGRPLAKEPTPQHDDGAVALRIYVDRSEAAQPAVEAVLNRSAKRWSLTKVAAEDGGLSVLEYRARPRKRVGLAGLRDRLLQEGSPYVIAVDQADRPA